MSDTQFEYEPTSSELGNCPNCASVVLREDRWTDRHTHVYYWPCCECGYTHYGQEIPDLD